MRIPKPQKIDNSKVYSTAEVAGLLNVSTRHVQNLMKENAIPGLIRLGTSVRFSKIVIDGWLSGETADATK